jgi:polyisoprenoid-binding protein YceI
MPRRTVLACFLVSLFALPTLAQEWKPVSASVTFTAKLFGVEVTGRFGGLNATLRFDPANPAAGQLTATVDARTVDTDNALRNRHLRERETFFDVEHYPTLRMKSTRLERTAEGYVGTFDLTMKDVTRPVRVPFRFERAGNVGTFGAQFELNRRDWHLGGSTFGLADRVVVRITVNAQSE